MGENRTATDIGLENVMCLYLFYQSYKISPPYGICFCVSSFNELTYPPYNGKFLLRLSVSKTHNRTIVWHWGLRLCWKIKSIERPKSQLLPLLFFCLRLSPFIPSTAQHDLTHLTLHDMYPPLLSCKIGGWSDVTIQAFRLHPPHLASTVLHKMRQNWTRSRVKSYILDSQAFASPVKPFWEKSAQMAPTYSCTRLPQHIDIKRVCSNWHRAMTIVKAHILYRPIVAHTLATYMST